MEIVIEFCSSNLDGPKLGLEKKIERKENNNHNKKLKQKSNMGAGIRFVQLSVQTFVSSAKASLCPLPFALCPLL